MNVVGTVHRESRFHNCEDPDILFKYMGVRPEQDYSNSKLTLNINVCSLLSVFDL